MWRCSGGVRDENYKSENGHGVSSLTADSTAGLAWPPLLAPFLFHLLFSNKVLTQHQDSRAVSTNVIRCHCFLPPFIIDIKKKEAPPGGWVRDSSLALEEHANTAQARC